jgi:hypothetical protein
MGGHTEALVRREAGESLTDIGRSYNVSHSTISRLSIPENQRWNRATRPSPCQGGNSNGTG